MNDAYIVTVYVVIDDLLKAMNSHRVQVSTDQVLTVAVVTATNKLEHAGTLGIHAKFHLTDACRNPEPGLGAGQ